MNLNVKLFLKAIMDLLLCLLIWVGNEMLFLNVF